MILQAELLDSNTVSDIIRTEILLLPLQQLHFFFENETSKLGGAFPELLKALGRFFVILNQPRPRGDMIALAYALTPNALFKFNIEAEQNQIVSSSKSNQTTTEPSDDVSKDSSQFSRYSNVFSTSTVFDPLKHNDEEQASSSTDNSSACKESQFPQVHFSDPTSIDENQTSTSLFNSFVSDPKGIETPLSITSFHSAIRFSEGIHLSHKNGLGFATTFTEETSSHSSEGTVSITNKNDELLDKLLRIFELTSEDINNNDEANDFLICEDFEDQLGLTDAELEAENDEF
ncbi:uncharacterized protein MONOS_12387 [Monocercomonoides exilis]|uniref:uncharacterized protein n=1 Tax=Monocercomonoides exilis TaxID=2049356 RepID=UPI0035593F45|nr:hypothetical protein MONOS_12387 [Monocercomonoides exilis]|eukprot:MONOS_12387.1-p1 / transcript=MONOS_12387.1 / gene=MONOS_12387 / organism=Monocercomonoides_exilis_PA203 / gene_product=unspecified product / transcript_product=unspecified product / location=Mono_scaffold00682:18439-19431(-) / protein_length=289 / sequence_SO=supercontig / SO=protein_coding / is_pseudo=false